MVNVDLKKDFKFVYKVINSKDESFKPISENYLKKQLKKLIKNKVKIDFNNLNEFKEPIKGVYLIFSIVDENLKFTYVGESENIIKRFRQHVNGYKNSKQKLYLKARKLVEDIKNIYFYILEEIEDQNERLKKETFYIYRTKSRFFSLNRKLVSRKLRCPNGHGMCRSYLTYNKNSEKLKLVIYARCKNKQCKQKFIIH